MDQPEIDHPLGPHTPCGARPRSTNPSHRRHEISELKSRRRYTSSSFSRRVCMRSLADPAATAAGDGDDDGSGPAAAAPVVPSSVLSDESDLTARCWAPAVAPPGALLGWCTWFAAAPARGPCAGTGWRSALCWRSAPASLARRFAISERSRIMAFRARRRAARISRAMASEARRCSMIRRLRADPSGSAARRCGPVVRAGAVASG